jgi:hypothetical protein
MTTNDEIAVAAPPIGPEHAPVFLAALEKFTAAYPALGIGHCKDRDGGVVWWLTVNRAAFCEMVEANNGDEDSVSRSIARQALTSIMAHASGVPLVVPKVAN